MAFLAREVPRWSVENQCYSCHNNGDAARALYTASGLKYALPAKVLDDTSAWLVRPETWHKNGGDVEYKDDGLARIQFAAALWSALMAGHVKDRRPFRAAAELIAKDQADDGTWQSQFKGDVGSPVTYGICLATAQARRILRQADPEKYEAAIARADAWILKTPVVRVLDAAAVLWALGDIDPHPAGSFPAGQLLAKLRECLETIRKGQSEDGGWGPFVNAGPEVFDTALVVIALSRLSETKETQDMLGRGRAWLIKEQKDDGSWPETTRPSGGTSYAQRISTTGWATLALLASRNRRE